MSSWIMQFRMLRRRLTGPAALYLTFVALLLITLGNPLTHLMVFRAYLFVLPLLTSLLAPGLLLDDPALEVLMTAPRKPIGWVLQRVLMLWLLSAVASLLLWGLVIWTGPAASYPPGWTLLIPSFALLALALLMSLIGTESIVGLAAIGVAWFGQLIGLAAFLAIPALSNFSLFLGVFQPESLLTQQLTMGAAAALFLALSAWLMGREYRYL